MRFVETSLMKGKKRPLVKQVSGTELSTKHMENWSVANGAREPREPVVF